MRIVRKKRKINMTLPIGSRLVIKEVFHAPIGGRRTALCICDCGKEKTLRLDHIVAGRVKSCGCLGVESRIIHDLSKHELYVLWKSMLFRCHNEKAKNYSDYGGRGIRVCDEWRHDPEGLKAFIKWNESLPPDLQFKKGLEIDRKNNNKGYSPQNCRWITPHRNMLNRRNTLLVPYKGKKVPFVDLYERFKGPGVSEDLARFRFCNRGWSLVNAIQKPVDVTKRNKRALIHGN